MKHIFIITNSFNKKLSDKFIENFKIPKEDIIFVATNQEIRGVTDKNLFFVKNNLRQINTSNFIRLIISSAFFCLITRRRANKKILELVDSQPFHLYLPHMYLFHFLFFYRHKNCKKLSLIEEGDGAYIKNRLNDSQKYIQCGEQFSVRLVYWLFGLNNDWKVKCSFPEQAQVSRAICVCEEAFPFYTNSVKTVINFEEIYQKSKDHKYTSRTMVLIDSQFLYGRYTEDNYLKAFKNFVEDNLSLFKRTSILVSFHPTLRNDDSFIERILNVLKKFSIDYEIFEQSIEEFLVSAERPNLYGLVSSSMRYAVMADAKVFSWLNYFPIDTVKNIEELYAYYHDIGVELV